MQLRLPALGELPLRVWRLLFCVRCLAPGAEPTAFLNVIVMDPLLTPTSGISTSSSFAWNEPLAKFGGERTLASCQCLTVKPIRPGLIDDELPRPSHACNVLGLS